MNQLNNNNISNEPSDAPQLCNNCFEFFGSKHTDFLCSGCHRSKAKEETQVKPVAIPAAVDNADAKTEANTPAASHKCSIDEESLIAQAKPVEVVEEKPKPVEKEANKCTKCTKKVGIMGHKCKCEFVFCKAHRLPEDHDCEFDFKQHGKEKLAKDNQQVVASKIARI